MKRIASFLLSSCIFILLLSINIFAETNRDIYNESVEQNKEYDSLNFSDSEKEKIKEGLDSLYQEYIRTYGEEAVASAAVGYDINILKDNTGFVKIYYDYDPRNDLISGLSIDAVIQKAEKEIEQRPAGSYIEQHIYAKPASDDVVLVCSERREYNVFEEPYTSYRAYSEFFKYFSDIDSLFTSAEITKNMEDVAVKQIYMFHVAAYIPIVYSEPVLAYISTNKGDFILYRFDVDCKCNEYLIPLDEFVSITEKMFEIESLYTDTDDKNRLEGIADLSGYLVGENEQEISQQYYRFPFFRNDTEFIGLRTKYHFIKGIGYESESQFYEALQKIDPAYLGVFHEGGFNSNSNEISWWEFLQILTDAGCTTYAECRAYIDAAIEAKENSISDTDVPTAEDKSEPSNQPSSDGRSYKLLAWIIPSAVVAISGAVATAVILKKKKRA